MSRFARPDMFRRSSASKLDIFYKVYGSQSIRAQIENRKSPASIVASWKANEQEFRRERAPFLLY
jgi:uncharacterized protein YbbC (DUF1343 family)